jgi:hypothetical protein
LFLYNNQNKTDYFDRLFSPGQRLLLGVCTLVPFFAMETVAMRFLSVMLFSVYAASAGKKISYLYLVSFTFSVTLFHLLTPSGLELFNLFGFPVTQGALRTGLQKGLAMNGFVYISLFSISTHLRLPGFLGSLLTEMFFYFDRIIEIKTKITKGKIFQTLDDELRKIYEKDKEKLQTRIEVPTTWKGIFFFIIILAANGLIFTLDLYLRTLGIF